MTNLTSEDWDCQESCRYVDYGGNNDQVQSLFGLDQNCESLNASLNAFGGFATFIRKEKFRGVIGIFVKVEICYFVSYANPTFVKKWVCFYLQAYKRVFPSL